jgi:hypothetical protein
MDTVGEFGSGIETRGSPASTASHLAQIHAHPPPGGIRQQYPQWTRKPE